MRYGTNYSMQVMVYQEFNDGVRCYNTTAGVSFVDNGMDTSGRCSSENGGCSFTYKYDPTLNQTDRGIQYGLFKAGQPNASPVSGGLAGRTCANNAPLACKSKRRKPSKVSRCALQVEGSCCMPRLPVTCQGSCARCAHGWRGA